MQTSRMSIVAVFFFAFVSTWCLAENDRVTILGAGSMLSLGQKLIDLYNVDYPGAKVGVNVVDSIERLPNGSSFIWQTIHPDTQPEKVSLRSHFGSVPRQIPIAIQGVLVTVNKNNPVQELSIDQLRAIYTGKVDNWNEVGGPNRRIRLYSTESWIGGSIFFRDLVLQGGNFDDTMQGFVNAKQTADAVAADVAGIGLIGVAGISSVKYPRIRRTPNSPGVDGSIANVRSLSYPLSTYLYWSFASDHSAAMAQFIQFALSNKGQLAIEASGCFPLNPTDRSRGSLAVEGGR